MKLSGTNETTGLVKSEELHEGFSTSADEKYEYTYDANGNVTEIKNVFDTGKNVSYEYDSLNRLTKETNLAIGSEWRYTYDNGGNITRKEEYNPSTGALVSS
ncbi:MAG: RHS repeat protein, partial [Staphylococcus sp.]|nr:RHS repeat protein [Staphylococcus sp.]